MKLHDMINELISLGESQSSIAAAIAGEEGAPTQSAISKLIRGDRQDLYYGAGKVIEGYYKKNIARLRRRAKR